MLHDVFRRHSPRTILMLLALLAAMVAVPAMAQDENPAEDAFPGGPEVQQALRSLWNDDSRENRERTRQIILDRTHRNMQVLSAALHIGPEFTEAPTGADRISFNGLDGSAQSTGCYVPTTYDPGERYPLIIWLHGGVNTDQRDRGPAAIQTWGPVCEAFGWCMIAPSAYNGASWWELNGAFNVLRSFKLFKGRYNIDENKVFVAGFSDGGAGVYWMLNHFPTLFAGGIVYSGHPALAGGENAYGQFSYYNLTNRPLLAFAGGRDAVFPPDQIQPFITTMEETGVDVEFHVMPDAGHEPAYIGETIQHLSDFVGNRSRQHDEEVTFEWDGTRSINRCDWLVIDEIGPVRAGEPSIPDVSTRVGRTLLGVTPADDQPDDGVAIGEVQANSAAWIAGLDVGDVIVRFNDADVASVDELQEQLASVRPGDCAHVWVRRESESPQPIEFIVEFMASRKVFYRGQPMGVVRAVADPAENTIDIECRGVRKLTLLLNTDILSDPSAPFRVVINGVTVHDTTVRADPSYTTMAMHESDRDRALIYIAKLQLEVPKPEASDW